MTFQSEIPDEKRRSRINVKPDKNLLESLKRGDQSAIQAALSMRNAAALAAVEEAIASRGGKSDVTFYRVGGQVVITPADRQDAFMKLTLMSGGNGLLQDPAYTQSLIARMGEEQNQVFLHLMQADVQAVYNYQLLGIQMQLGVMVGESPQSAKFRPLKYVLYTIGSLVLIALFINLITYLSSDEHRSDLSRKAEIVVNKVNWDAWDYIRYLEDYHLNPPHEGDKFILVDITITNKTSKYIDFYDLPDKKPIYLKDSSGNKYYLTNTIYLQGHPYCSGVPRKNSYSWTHYFEVPDDVEITELVIYGMHADMGEVTVIPTPDPVPYGSTLEASNGMSVTLKDASWGQDDTGDFVFVYVDSKNVGKKDFHYSHPFYLIDSQGEFVGFPQGCESTDRKYLFDDMEFTFYIQPGFYFSGYICFHNLDNATQDYRLVFYSADGFSPNYTLLLPEE